jgi:hypothetical protein
MGETLNRRRSSIGAPIDWPSLCEPIARAIWGAPSTETGTELRWGTRGSRVVDRQAGLWFDHENGIGGGALDLVPGDDIRERMRWLAEHHLIDDALKSDRRHMPCIVATYDYTDEKGNLLFQVVRYDPKDFRQRRPDGHGGWIWALDDTRRVLYRLPELPTAIEWDDVIYVVEGEKDVDSLRARKLVATCNPGGAGKWRAEYNDSLRGADVVIISDNDQSGQNHADQVAAALHGTAKRVRVLNLARAWTECPSKGDISDWLAAGGTAERLAAVVDALPDWRPSVEKKSAPLTAAEFLALELPPRKTILAPWLREKGLVMVYSPRGVGKTLFGLTSAYAIAVGAGFLKFSISGPRKVLYIDGEMPAQTMQERLAAIVNGFAEQPPTPEHFRILISDLSENGLPDLATPEGQTWIDAQVGEAEVIFLDNISTLVRSGKENEAEAWLPIQSWTLRHRRAGREIVFFHHAGKGGAQRGTSRREDVLDTVISLRRPSDYSPDQGCRFELHYEKCRGFYGDEAQPFAAKYEVRKGAAVWTQTEIVDAERARVVAAMKDGMSIREAAEELGMHRSKVERLRKKALDNGELSSVPTSEAAE